MKKTYLTIMILLFARTIHSQDTVKSVNLDSISIKSTAITLEQSAPSGDKLTSKHLQIINTPSAGDAAKFFSGVTVRDYGGLGGVKTVSVRGLSSNHTAVLYDGVNLFDNQSGQIDLSKYSLSSVGSLSLANAQFTPSLPTATSLASASSINIETKKPNMDSTRVKGDASLSYGSFNLFNANTFIATKVSDKDIISLSADLTNTNGRYPYKLYYGVNQQLSTDKLKRENNDLFSYHGELNWYHTFSSKNSLKTKAYYYYSNRGLPANVTLWYQNSAQRLWNKNFFAQTVFTSYINDRWTYKNNFKFDYNFTHYKDPHTFVTPSGDDDTYKQSMGYMNNAVSFMPHGDIILTLTNDFAVSALNSTILDDDPLRFSSLTAFVVEKRLNHWLITADVLHSMYNERYQGLSKTRNYLSPYISLKYSNGNYTSVIFYKNIFRIPTFNELYYRKYGNTDLNPEKTNQLSWVNILQFSVHDITFTPEIDLYYNNVRDKIVALPKNNLFLWSMLNYGKVDIYGTDVKLTVSYVFSSELNADLKVNYSYQRALNKDKNSTTYNQLLPYMPEHIASAVLGVYYKTWRVGYTCLYTGDRYSLQENIPQNLLKAYFEHSANATYNIKLFKSQKENLALTFAINNIFNKQYDVVRSYPMMGRNFNLKVQINF